MSFSLLVDIPLNWTAQRAFDWVVYVSWIIRGLSSKVTKCSIFFKGDQRNQNFLFVLFYFMAKYFLCIEILTKF